MQRGTARAGAPCERRSSEERNGAAWRAGRLPVRERPGGRGRCSLPRRGRIDLWRSYDTGRLWNFQDTPTFAPTARHRRYSRRARRAPVCDAPVSPSGILGRTMPSWTRSSARLAPSAATARPRTKGPHAAGATLPPLAASSALLPPRAEATPLTSGFPKALDSRALPNFPLPALRLSAPPPPDRRVPIPAPSAMGSPSRPYSRACSRSTRPPRPPPRRPAAAAAAAERDSKRVPGRRRGPAACATASPLRASTEGVESLVPAVTAATAVTAVLPRAPRRRRPRSPQISPSNECDRRRRTTPQRRGPRKC